MNPAAETIFTEITCFLYKLMLFAERNFLHATFNTKLWETSKWQTLEKCNKKII